MSDDSAALLQMLASDRSLDTETIRDGFMRAVRAWDAKAFLALLTRYLAQPLSDYSVRRLFRGMEVSDRHTAPRATRRGTRPPWRASAQSVLVRRTGKSCPLV